MTDENSIPGFYRKNKYSCANSKVDEYNNRKRILNNKKYLEDRIIKLEHQMSKVIECQLSQT